ncbi:hypothetical protein Bxe_C1241 [Paraburkholderia xenovorans LB400]|uniref:Uncharacterized protein n=1 Tax=Paraburkholderia xenovorans (strain LB400) TaxID=266265 RepID=Q13FN8_PARXL|nr:hypothetical protein Bxe_C1241 [Paraburkholderia xenovorans LB400]
MNAPHPWAREQRKADFHGTWCLRTWVRGLQALHDDFLRQCREAGLTAIDYPFNMARPNDPVALASVEGRDVAFLRHRGAARTRELCGTPTSPVNRRAERLGKNAVVMACTVRLLI